MKRRNFSRPVAVEIAKRALRPDGQMACEKCGAIGGKLELHHLVMDAMETDKSRKLTAADGAMWCQPCHKPETKAQAAILAEARAREASALSVSTPSRRPMNSPQKPKRESRPVANGMTNLARRFRSAT